MLAAWTAGARFVFGAEHCIASLCPQLDLALVHGLVLRAPLSVRCEAGRFSTKGIHLIGRLLSPTDSNAFQCHQSTARDRTHSLTSTPAGAIKDMLYAAITALTRMAVYISTPEATLPTLISLDLNVNMGRLLFTISTMHMKRVLPIRVVHKWRYAVLLDPLTSEPLSTRAVTSSSAASDPSNKKPTTYTS